MREDAAASAEAPVVSHRRIRPFNTRDTYPEQDLDNDLARRWSPGTPVYLRGQVGQDLDTAGVGRDRRPGRAGRAGNGEHRRCCSSEAARGSRTSARRTVYLTDIRYREAVYGVLGQWLEGVHPVFTGVVVTALARPEWVVEVDVIAVIPTTERRMTFSLVGRCERTGMVGRAWCRRRARRSRRGAPTPAPASARRRRQNITDPRLGPACSTLLAEGRTAEQAVDARRPRPRRGLPAAHGLDSRADRRRIRANGHSAGMQPRKAGMPSPPATSSPTRASSPRWSGRSSEPTTRRSASGWSPRSRPASRRAARRATCVQPDWSSQVVCLGRSPTCGSTGRRPDRRPGCPLGDLEAPAG